MRVALIGAALLAAAGPLRADIAAVEIEEPVEDPPAVAAFRAAWAMEVRDGKPREAAAAYLRIEKEHAESWFSRAAKVRRALCLAAAGDAEGSRKAAREIDELPDGLSSLRPILDRLGTEGEPSPPDPEAVKRRIAGLSSDDFGIRETSARELERLGGTVLAAIREALKSPADLETRVRLEAIERKAGAERWVGLYEQEGRVYPLVLELSPGPDGALEGSMREPAMDWGGQPGDILAAHLKGRRTPDGAFVLIKEYEHGTRWRYDGRLKDGCVRGLYVPEDYEPTEEERDTGENRILLRREPLDLSPAEKEKE